VVADADDGSVAQFGAGLEREGLRYAVATRSNVTMWKPGARRTRTAAAIGRAIPETDWQRVCWGHGTKRAAGRALRRAPGALGPGAWRPLAARRSGSPAAGDPSSNSIRK